MSNINDNTVSKQMSNPSLRELLRRAVNALEDLEHRTGNTVYLTDQVKRLADNLDQIILNLDNSTNDFKEALEANTQRLDDIYDTLTEILEQSHNPFRPLPSLPIGRGNHSDEEESTKKPRQTKQPPKLDKIDKEGFGKWK